MWRTRSSRSWRCSVLKLHNLDRSVKKLSELQRRTRDPKHLDEVGTELVARHRAAAPVKEGTLRDNITYRVLPDGTLAVGANKAAWYWRFVEYGTAPHPIEARQYADRRRRPSRRRRRAGKKVLASEDTIYGVRLTRGHPGARAHPFIRPVIDEGRRTITRELAGSLAKAAEDL